MRYGYNNTKVWVSCLLSVQRDIQQAFPNYVVTLRPHGGMREIIRIDIISKEKGGIFDKVIYEGLLKEENRVFNVTEIINDINNEINRSMVTQ